MPFAAASQMDEDKLKAQDKNGAAPNISGESGGFATGVPGQESSAGKQTKGSGDKFANIQSYLSANKDQGEQMGQKVTSDVEKNASDATQKVQDFSTKAPTVQAYDPSAAYANVTSLSDADKQAYNAAKAGYKGPQQLDQVEGYGDTSKAVGTASQQVQNAGNEAGQRELLKQTYKRPSYTGGENALDQTIVQNAPGARAGFEGLTQKYSGLSNMFNTAAQDVGGKVNAAAKQGLANQNAINTGEAKAKADLLDPIRARAQAQNEAATGRITGVTNDVSDDTLSADTLAALGLTEGQNLYDLDLKSYLTPNYTQAGINNVANADERSRYAALTNLIGGKPGQEITAEGQAINPIGLNKEQFEKDLGGKKAEYEKAYASKGQSILDPNNLNIGQSFNGDFQLGLGPLSSLSPQELQEKALPAIAAAPNANSPGMQDLKQAIEKSLGGFYDTFKSKRQIKKG
jgi:hypothetical protein